MGLEIQKTLSVGAIQPNIYVNRNNLPLYFGTSSNGDTFEKTSVKSFTTEAAINKMLLDNPEIKKITRDFNPELKLNIEELEKLLNGHSKDTQQIAKGITDNLPFSLRYKVDTKAIDQAAYLHDIGKVLIPKEILNKNGKLNETETRIMHKHSELGYEMLKKTNLDKITLNLVRNHHQNAQKSGYPWVSNDFKADINLQILTAADKYSALTEERVYKKPIDKTQALIIIYQDVKEGKLHPFVFKALVNYVNNNVYSKVS